MGTFTGARKWVLQTFATTQSALMKKRVSRFMKASWCPACHGKRLKPEALRVKFAGYDIAEISQLPLTQVAQVLRPVAHGPVDWRALVIAAAAAVALLRYKVGVIPVIAACAVAGLVLSSLA